MTEQTEEQVAKQKALITAMKGAKDAMAQVLDRNTRLEAALVSARDALSNTKRWIAADVYLYGIDSGGRQTSVHTHIDGQVANIQKVLG